MLEYHFNFDYDHYSEFAAAALSPITGAVGGLFKDVTGAFSAANAQKNQSIMDAYRLKYELANPVNAAAAAPSDTKKYLIYGAIALVVIIIIFISFLLIKKTK